MFIKTKSTVQKKMLVLGCISVLHRGFIKQIAMCSVQSDITRWSHPPITSCPLGHTIFRSTLATTHLNNHNASSGLLTVTWTAHVNNTREQHTWTTHVTAHANNTREQHAWTQVKSTREHHEELYSRWREQHTWITHANSTREQHTWTTHVNSTRE